MIPTIILAPLDAPQIFKPAPVSPKPPRLDWQDELLLERLREADSCATWSLLNAVANEQSPRDRTAGQLLRLQLWDRLKRLRGLGLAFTQGRNRVSSSKPDPAARRPAVRRRRRNVRGLRAFRAVSADTGSGSQQAPCATHQVHRQMVREPSIPCPPTIQIEKTVSGNEPQGISEAARQLAKLPRRPRRVWSGWIDDKVRSYRNLPVRLPGGEQVYAFGARRGLLVYVREPDLCPGDPDLAGRSWGVVRASEVEVVRNPHAVLLGQMKAGTRERPSPSKAATARRNGAKPARRGPRGRPRKFTPP